MNEERKVAELNKKWYNVYVKFYNSVLQVYI